MEINPALNSALQSILIILANLLIALIGYFTWRFTQWVEAKKQDTQWGMLLQLAITAVQSVEQSSLNGVIVADANVMKEAAINQLQILADAKGIKVDVAMMSAVIESLIIQGIHKGTAQTATATATVTTSPTAATPVITTEVSKG